VLPAQSATILLLLAGWLSLRLRRSGWQNVGMSRPVDWRRTLLAGTGIGALYQLFSIGILVPVLYRLTNTPLDLSQFASLRGNLTDLLLWLAISWSLAAFGEEMAYRGYLFNRLVDLLGNNRLGWGIGIVVSALLFGLGHIYQGITGVLETCVFGAVMACLYLATKRNLWLPIIVHGVNDTVGFVLIFSGLYP
jgi:membrane protease YdiL (CAAX protease family)